MTKPYFAYPDPRPMPAPAHDDRIKVSQYDEGIEIDMWPGVEEFDPAWLEGCTLVASGEADKISDARELLNDLVRHILAR